ncbi:MAG: multiheme c-type cytochrome [Candidatus Kapaibacteriales bacterium]
MKNKNFTFIVISLMVLAIIVIVIITVFTDKTERLPLVNRGLITKTGVCPPFFLYDENDSLIDPVHGINADKPFSPKNTCGKCHDYNLITQGYHFQQGKDETVSGILAERYQWVSHPGNYGGNWCSPAPLYNYLSKKDNQSAKEMDMTSFTFITNGCGTCHPGGGPLEYDRKGFRYDKYMDSVKYTAGGINNFDGDYFKAHWNRSGVIEADCNICHQPDYDFSGRSKNLLNWNFRWLATAGSKLAKVEGSVKDSVEVKVEYDLSKFDKEGKVSMNLVREPRNENCLNCHAKPQWKKRGSSFSPMTDVHIAKGLRCVDCHVAGSMATNPLIKGKEVHQIGKGDDPSGWVRNDLDNTMRTCTDCHLTGYMNAPIAQHKWLPSYHLEKLSCQACHIPVRKTKSALVQVSDVYNPGTKIKPPTKYLWTFYDQHMNYWNHYGELEMFGFKDQPSDYFYPQYTKYKGQIFPVNPVHSAWPGIYTEGKKGLDQPKMKDIYDMWMAYKKDHTKYPQLAVIKDDNNDSVPEVNRPEEIDAFINSVTAFLIDNGYDLDNKKVVWVNNDRMYLNGKEYKLLKKEYYESSPYASVYKYSHDVAPAKSALGVKGCTECHSFNSKLFYSNVVKYPFGEDGKTVYEPQYVRLNMNPFFVWISAFREQWVKSFLYPLFLLLLTIVLIAAFLDLNSRYNYFKLNNAHLTIIYIMLVGAFTLIWLKPDVRTSVLPDRMWFDNNHFLISIIALFISAWSYLTMKKDKGNWNLLIRVQLISIALAIFSGILMMIKFDAIESIVKIAYTLFDINIVANISISIIYFVRKQFNALVL